MEWTKDNEPYTPRDKCRGIIYKMTYEGKVYYGKKTITDPKGKPVKYGNYYGSSKAWKEYIQGNESKVIREVLYECVNKSEMYYYKLKVIIDSHGLFDSDCFNGNIGMVTTSNHTKNFFNKPAS